jgi:hypothetical protein
MSTLRLLLALAAAKGWNLCHVDITAAFLNGVLPANETAYLETPDEFKTAGTDTVCKLHKALYGLKQAPRLWHQTLKAAMQKIGLHPAQGDPSLYVYADGTSVVYVLVYVDDLLLAGPDGPLLNKIKALLLTEFKGRDLGFPTLFLGIKIDRDAATGALKLSQPRHIADALTKFGVTAKPRATPIAPGYDLTPTALTTGRLWAL